MTESRQWFVIDVIFVLVEFIVVAVEVMVLVIDMVLFGGGVFCFVCLGFRHTFQQFFSHISYHSVPRQRHSYRKSGPKLHLVVFC